MEAAKQRGVQIHLPVDAMIADEFSNLANRRKSKSGEIPDGWMGLDVGPEAVKTFKDAILASKTILWNGPMGVFEFENFREGTLGVAKAMAEATKQGSFSLVGGGDSVAAINLFNMASEVSYVSTGGGAMLEFLEGLELPGIKAIRS
jgi:phosphoglycerate kinase